MIRTTLSVFAALCLSACVATPPLPTEPTPAPTPSGSTAATSGSETEALSLINVERARIGAAPLSPDVHLSKLAREYAELMVRDNFFDHDTPGGLTYEQRMAAAGYDDRVHGENIFWGSSNPNQAVTSWMNSRGHRANILNRKFQNIGVGYARPNHWVTIFTDR